MLYRQLGRPDREVLTVALESLAARNLVISRRVPPAAGRKTDEQWRATTAIERLTE